MRRTVLGLGALIAIIATVVGVPTILTIAAGNPLLTGDQLQSILTLTPDYGNTILLTKLLPSAGWIAWLLFVIPFFLELGAAIAGHKTTKRLPIFRGQQHVAAALIAAVLVMFAGTAMLGNAQPANAAPAPTSISQDAAQSTPAPSTVVDEETPAPAAETPTPTVETTTVQHTVAPGESLWSISEHYYGDGTYDLDIFNASTSTVQADGQQLTHPDLIRPGWQLNVPNVQVQQTPTPAPAPEPEAPSPASSASAGASVGQVDAGAPSGVHEDGGAGGGAGGSSERAEAPTAAPSASVQGPSSSPSSSASSVGEAQGEVSEADMDLRIPLMTGGGIAGILAAGLLSALGARRLKQRRKRRAGTRIAMPEEAAATAELELRMIENPLGVQDIDNALRTLQIWAEDSGSALPELFALRLDGEEIALYLNEPADLPAPFVQAAEDRTAWVVLPGTATAPSRASVSPYPALTTIGVDDHSGVLMLDLEQVGSLKVVGDEDTARGVLNAIAVELAENPWSEQIEVTLVGMPDGLARDLDRFRIQHVDDVAALVRNLRASLEGRADAFASHGVDDIHTARTTAAEDESWAPHVVILGELPAPEIQAELNELVERVPRLGVATIANGDMAGHGSVVRISSPSSAELVSPGEVMPPLPFTPQLLQGRELELIQELFATTEQEPVLAPVEPTVPAVVADPVVETETTSAGADVAEQDPAAEAPAPLSAVDEIAREAQPTSLTVDENLANGELIEEEATAVDQTVPDWPAPYVRMLGAVDVLHLSDDDRLPGRGIELLAYLSLTAPVNGPLLQQAFWPDTVDAKGNQRKLVRLVRNALGAAPDGSQLFPENKNQDGYRLHPAISTDWDDFRKLIGPDVTKTTNEDLVAAIKLVRGTPFAGTNTRRGWWVWIPMLQEEMIAAIMDAADELARRALESHDSASARYAAGVAKAVEPLNEAGWRTELRAAMQDHNTDEINRIVDEMYARVGGGDPEFELDHETAELVETATR